MPQYFFPNLFISFNVFFLCLYNLKIQALPIKFFGPSLVGALAYFAYNYLRNGHFSSLVFIIPFFFFSNPLSFSILVLNVFFVICYKKYARPFPYIKILIISFALSSSSLMPLNLSLSRFPTLLFLENFFFIFILCLPFDLFDAHSDEFKTIGKHLSKTKRYFISMNVLLIFFFLLKKEIDLFSLCFTFALNFFGVSFFYIRKTKSPPYYLDGLMFLRFLLLYF